MMCYEPMELLYLTVYLVSLAIVVNIVIIPPSSLDSKIIPLDQEPTSRPSGPRLEKPRILRGGRTGDTVACRVRLPGLVRCVQRAVKCVLVHSAITRWENTLRVCGLSHMAWESTLAVYRCTRSEPENASKLPRCSIEPEPACVLRFALFPAESRVPFEFGRVTYTGASGIAHHRQVRHQYSYICTCI
ncbi:hypothetical protein BD309DRAFT_49264 [Dichomitus squalens]|uniref:Uncharacterized protein n=1 Tax=Dichomitus squalens TaxID=114155 RepID=A0A4Q9PZ60_9APHY|nr:hypothetical protein BD309DRAFT_49264 [Dichomitus squalens]TBU60102.1 hypothetical protein BD310DRAFT_346776 [Dichomitus squalens]